MADLLKYLTDTQEMVNKLCHIVSDIEGSNEISVASDLYEKRLIEIWHQLNCIKGELSDRYAHLHSNFLNSSYDKIWWLYPIDNNPECNDFVITKAEDK